MRNAAGRRPSLVELFEEIRDQLAAYAYSPEVNAARQAVRTAEGAVAVLPLLPLHPAGKSAT